MKHTKKLLCLILSALLLLGVFPVTVFAEGNVCKIGDTEYATLPAAVAAAKDGDTIELIADTSFDSTMTVNKSITINGNGHKVTTANNTWCYFFLAKGTDGKYTASSPMTVRIYNIQVASSCLFCDEGSVPLDVTLEKVTYTTGGIAAYHSIALARATSVKLTIKDSSICRDNTTSKDVVIWGDNSDDKNTDLKARADIRIVNSTLTRRSSPTQDKADNWSAVIRAPKSSIYVDGTSTIASECTAGYEQYAFTIGGNVTLASGATIRLAPTGAMSYGVGLSRENSATVTNNGAKFVVVNPDPANSMNLYLPNLPTGDKYSDGTNEYTGGTIVIPAGGSLTLNTVLGAPRVCRNGVNEYSTLTAAIAAAAEGDTITLIADITGNSFLPTKSLTIDGNGHTITDNGGIWDCTFRIPDSVTGTQTLNLTLKNLTVMNSGSLLTDEGGGQKDGAPLNVTIENVTANITKTDSKQKGIHLKNVTTLQIVNSVISHKNEGWNGTVFVKGSNATVIDIRNSTISKNDCCYGVIEAGSNTTVKIDGTSILENVTGYGGNDEQNIFQGTMKVELAKNATLRFNMSVPKSIKFFRDAATIEDHGARYEITHIQSLTATLPALANNVYTDGTDYYSNTVAVTAGQKITLTRADLSIDTKNVAAIRLADPYGIRFTGVANEALVAAVAAGKAKVGFLVAPSALLNGAALTDAVDPANYIKQESMGWSDAANGEFRGTIVGNSLKSEDGVKTAFSARAYVEITLVDGTVVTYYAEHTTAASLAQVAGLYKAQMDSDYVENEVIEQILAWGGNA